VLFVVSKRVMDGFDVVVIELRAPCTVELALCERSFETVRADDELVAHRCTAQPDATSAARAADHKGRRVAV
jgi:hypothetical protein